MPNRNRVLRLSRYKNAVLKLKSLNFTKVFSDNLADATGVTASQVRKDFSLFGITGNRRGGYKVDELLAQLNKILGKDKIQRFIVVGVGNIGRALLNYPGFVKSGIKIVAGFETDHNKFDDNAKVPIKPLENLVDYTQQHNIELGIIAVPDFAAQQVFDIMAEAGIKGIFNFSPVRLAEKTDIVVNNLNLETEFENLIYFVNSEQKPSEE